MARFQNLVKESHVAAIDGIHRLNLGFAKITLLLMLVPVLTALVLVLFILPFSGAVASPSPAPQAQYAPPDPSLIFEASLDAAAELADIDFTAPDVDSQVVLDLLNTEQINVQLVGVEQVDQLLSSVGMENVPDLTDVSGITAVMTAVGIANQSPELNGAILVEANANYYEAGGLSYDQIIPTATIFDLLAADAPVIQVDGQQAYVSLVQDGDNQLADNALNAFAALFAQ